MLHAISDEIRKKCKREKKTHSRLTMSFQQGLNNALSSFRPLIDVLLDLIFGPA